MQFELKLQGRRGFVTWEGESGEDAALRYVDCHPEATVIAWRNYPRTGIFAIERPDRMRIVEPTPGWGPR